MLHRYIVLFILLIIFPVALSAIPYQFTEKLEWKPIQQINLDSEFSFERLVFEGANFKGLEPLPHFRKSYPIHSDLVDLDIRGKNRHTIHLSTWQLTSVLSPFSAPFHIAPGSAQQQCPRHNVAGYV